MKQRTIPRAYPADLSGVTTEWLAHANGCSAGTIRRERSALSSPSSEGLAILAGMTPELGLELAHLRPSRGMLPYWSRLAIAAFAATGSTYKELMVMFRVGRSTVYRALKARQGGYASLSGQRVLSGPQKAPVPSGAHTET